MFQFFAFFYWLVAYYFGGPHWRCLLIHFLSDGLRPIRSCHFYWSLPGGRCDFSYWHGIALLLVNPAVFVNYGQIGALLCAFIYSCLLIGYLIVCYVVTVQFVVECAAIAYDNLKRYNRGSLFRQSIHRCRCYARDLWEGQATVPHFLHSYLLLCFLWASHLAYRKLYNGTLLQYSLFVNICLDNTMVSFVALYRCGSLC